MANVGTREAGPPERMCCEEGCDRPAALGEARCEYHVLRLGGRPRAPDAGPRALPVVDVPVLDAVAPTKAAGLSAASEKRAWPRLAGAAACQALGLASVAALLETFRFLDFDAFDGLPNLALFAVPYSDLLNLYLPVAGWLGLTTVQLVLAWTGRRAASGAWGRRAGTALLVAGVLTAVASATAVGSPLLLSLFGATAASN